MVDHLVGVLRPLSNDVNQQARVSELFAEIKRMQTEHKRRLAAKEAETGANFLEISRRNAIEYERMSRELIETYRMLLEQKLSELKRKEWCHLCTTRAAADALYCCSGVSYCSDGCRNLDRMNHREYCRKLVAPYNCKGSAGPATVLPETLTLVSACIYSFWMVFYLLRAGYVCVAIFV